MIELSRHIEILLLSNDCVIVPNLGGFMAHHEEAQYDEKESLFLPPLRTIGFNPQLKMNDSLLVQSYIEAYDISYPEALSRIEDEVNEVKQNLEHQGVYEFNDIGKLSLNEDGNLTFEPCEAGILTPELYGLSSFELVSLDKLFTQEVESKKTAPVAVPAQEEESKATILPFPEEEDEEKTIQIRVSLLRNIAAVCIIIIVFFLFSEPLAKNDSAALQKSNIDTGILTRILPKDITTGSINSEDINSTKKEVSKVVAEKPAVKEKKTSTPTLKGAYTIVLASHVSKENAEEFVKKLKEEGLTESKVLDRPNASTKVVYGSYATKSDAQKGLSKLNDSDRFADAWVLKFN